MEHNMNHVYLVKFSNKYTPCAVLGVHATLAGAQQYVLKRVNVKQLNDESVNLHWIQDGEKITAKCCLGYKEYNDYYTIEKVLICE